METIKEIIKILLLYLLIFWVLGLIYHLFVSGLKINNTNDFVRAIFNPNIFYLYFVIAFFEVFRFLYEKNNQS